MSKTTWHKGAPPSIGWWPASISKISVYIRWWDGEKWSLPAYQDWTAIEAADVASLKMTNQKDICWTERWWL
jgi:hypothetical protein